MATIFICRAAFVQVATPLRFLPKEPAPLAALHAPVLGLGDKAGTSMPYGPPQSSACLDCTRHDEFGTGLEVAAGGRGHCAFFSWRGSSRRTSGMVRSCLLLPCDAVWKNPKRATEVSISWSGSPTSSSLRGRCTVSALREPRFSEPPGPPPRPPFGDTGRRRPALVPTTGAPD